MTVKQTKMSENVLNLTKLVQIKPVLKWHIEEINENWDTEAGEFTCLINVDDETEHNFHKSNFDVRWNIQADKYGQLRQLPCTFDVSDMTQCLLQSAINNCDPGIAVDGHMIRDIALKLAKAIGSPLDEYGGHVEPIIYSLMPAIAMQRETGEVLAYAVGQLVAGGNSSSSCSNNKKIVIVVRGCAINNKLRQCIIESISKSLLPVNET